MAATEVAAGDLIQIVLQFCKENSLLRTFQTLQEESGVAHTICDDVEGFVSNINAGNWDAVLASVATLTLPATKLVNLYEQIIMEMLELRENETARALLHQTEAMQTLKARDWDRYRRLEDLMARTYFDARETYGELNKERRRSQLASSLEAEVTTVPPSRLLALVGQALKWQQYQGMLPPGERAWSVLHRCGAAALRSSVRYGGLRPSRRGLRPLPQRSTSTGARAGGTAVG
jgi:WD40 repeat-containing protein SMU1